MRIRPGIELGNLTDVGCVRAENEDYYCYAEPEADEDFRRRGRLAVVADGMGGHAGGQVASGLAVDEVRRIYLGSSSTDPGEALVEAFCGAHQAIQSCGEERPELRGMGTTCTAVALRDGELYVGHVGDSRLYLMRESRISRLTRDHSLVNRLLEEGAITPEEASTHPERNVLTAALGMNAPIAADFGEAPVPVHGGDVLLLCTDGLHGLVADEELLAVSTERPPRDACQTLVAMARERGAPDNVTLQIIRIIGS
jgi:PPM family protein phosphatase